MKKIIGIIGVVICLVGFSTYYYYSYVHYNSIVDRYDSTYNPVYGVLNFLPLMWAVAFLSIQLAFKAANKYEYRIYGYNATLWTSISIAYVLKDVLHLITTKIFIISILSLWLLIGLSLYFYKSLRNRVDL